MLHTTIVLASAASKQIPMHNPGQTLSDDLYFLPLVLHELEGREEALMEIAVIRACTHYRRQMDVLSPDFKAVG
jgi:hypothetical protein